MRISCISTSRIPSDTANGIQVMKTCHAIARAGHEVVLLLPGEEYVPCETLADQYGLSVPFPVQWLPARPTWKHNDFALTAVLAARRAGIDCIYTWTGQSAALALLLGIPTIFEAHDMPTGTLGPLWTRLIFRLPEKKRLLPITRALQQRLERQFGAFSHGDVVISPNGVDLEAFADLPGPPAARAALQLPEQPTVLCAGHLYAGRGVELFLGLAARFSQAHFLWAGGRPQDVNAVRARAQSLGLHNITFLGFLSQRQLPAYQAAADVLLMPYARSIAGSGGGNSAEICSPMKMFDYLAAGRAILSSDLPVIHEVLNANNAIFAPPEDLQSWSSALESLLEDGTLRARLGTQARADAAQYTWLERAQRALAGF
jgi:glycosyltransferase involved in cell wall biosynthesis